MPTNPYLDRQKLNEAMSRLFNDGGIWSNMKDKSQDLLFYALLVDTSGIPAPNGQTLSNPDQLNPYCKFYTIQRGESFKPFPKYDENIAVELIQGKIFTLNAGSFFYKNPKNNKEERSDSVKITKIEFKSGFNPFGKDVIPAQPHGGIFEEIVNVEPIGPGDGPGGAKVGPGGGGRPGGGPDSHGHPGQKVDPINMSMTFNIKFEVYKDKSHYGNYEMTHEFKIS